MDDAIFPECYVDTNLIETLVPPIKRGNQQGYNHQKGCGTVGKRMREKYGDRFAVGIIDTDKQELDYLKEFKIIQVAGSLILHRHNNPAVHHYIIQINPAIERFILESAASVNVSLEDFGLPSDLARLCKSAKKVNSKFDPDFKKLFRTIHSKGAPQFLKLAAWIGYLKEATYRVDVDKFSGL